MSRVGLVLGGGGTTGASYHLGALLAIEMATGWDPDDAEVIVGTSAGAFTAAMIRGGELSLDTFLDGGGDRSEVAARLQQRIYRRTRPRGVLRWMRRGVLPNLTHPDVRLIVGSPAIYCTTGIEEWVTERIGPMAAGWPEAATVIVAFDLSTGKRVGFGTDAAPVASLAQAVSASVAIPMVFQPVEIDGVLYLDGGLASGTSADFVLGADEPLDLVLVIAPMAADEPRKGARFYETVVDKAGCAALDAELARIRREWPSTDIVVLRPDEAILDVTRPNPLSTQAAIPAFLRTLRSLRETLAEEETWATLQRHLRTDGNGRSVAAQLGRATR